MVWVITAISLPGKAARAAKSTPAPAPDLLVLVSAERNAKDRVAIAYKGVVSDQQARGDVRALLTETHWTASDIVVDTARLAPGEPETTSVEFTAPVVVPYPEGVLPVAALIQTFKRYHSMVLVFQTQRPYRFIGPGSYQSRQVVIRLQQSPETYRYDVQVLDPSFDKLRLPNVVAASGKGTGEKRTPSFILIMLLAVGAAVSIGVAVYLFASARTTAPKNRGGRRHGAA
ncbi:MAG TPA: hypothetical protein VHR86_02640 [Armatimonadota bacterium]|nr:hypothetical protein [Armatimonadota bacterium]